MHKIQKNITFFFFAILLIVSSSALAQELTLTYNSTKIIEGQNNFSKVVSVDQDIVIAEILSSNRIKLTGVGIGSTYVYVWWSDESYSVYKVSVIPPVVQNTQDNTSLSLVKEKPLKFEVTATSYGGQSNSIYPINRWAYGGFFSGIRMYGDTNLGSTNSYVHYEGYNGVNSLTRFSINLSGQDYYAGFGDDDIFLSDITVPYMHFQGLKFRKDLSEQVSVLLITGARGQGFWGKDSLRDTRNLQKFAALQTTFNPSKQLSIDVRAVTSSTEGQSLKSDIFGIAAKYSPGYWLSIMGDVAKSGDDTALLSQVDYNDRGLSFKGIYKSIPATFVFPSDYTNQQGVEGFFVSGSYSPYSFIRLSGHANRYKNNLLQSATSEYNSDISANLDLFVNKNLTITYSPWQNDQRGYSNGGLAQGSLAQATYSFMLGGPSNLFLRYQPSKLTGLNTSESDYLYESTTLGGRIGLSDAFFIDIENEWNSKSSFGTTANQDGRVFRAIGTFNSQIGKTPLFTFAKIYYSNGTVAGSPSNQIWGEVELSYKPKADTKFYIKGKTADYSGSVTNPIDRSEKHLVCGFNAVIDSNLSIGRYASVKGYVFVDKNGNGIKDKSEIGVPNAKVFIKGGKSVYTNSEGAYEINNVNVGETTVYLDMSSVSNGYLLTNSNPVKLPVKLQSQNRADFGLRKISSLKIKVFADLNSNGVFDATDRAIPVFQIVVDGKKYISDFEGKIFIYDIEPGMHSIVIDSNTLPSKIIPLVPLNNSVEITDSGIYEFSVPIKLILEKNLKNTSTKQVPKKHTTSSMRLKSRNKKQK